MGELEETGAVPQETTIKEEAPEPLSVIPPIVEPVAEQAVVEEVKVEAVPS